MPKRIIYGELGSGNMGPQGERHWNASGLRAAAENDMQAGKVLQPFSFVYNMFSLLQAQTPDAIKNLERLYGEEVRPDYRDPGGVRQRQIELAASSGEYDQNPKAKSLTMRALADSMYASSAGLLENALRSYTGLVYHGRDDEVYRRASHIDEFLIGAKDTPFTGSVVTLWKKGEEGKFSEALTTLLPLVNLLAERESNGVFPLGMSKDGIDLTQMRYQTDAGVERMWAINQTSPDIRNAVLMVITAAGPQDFVNERARIYAANMLTMMADPEAGVGYHLPGDLQWLMVCHDQQQKGEPLPNRYPGHPAVPWDHEAPKPLLALL